MDAVLQAGHAWIADHRMPALMAPFLLILFATMLSLVYVPAFSRT